jgi:hypothetical protein
VTERVPQQRHRFAQRRAEANQVPTVFDEDNAVLDESFVAAAPVREPSAADRALHRHLLPDQRTGEAPLPLPTPPRWSVRPSHRFDALRPLPVVAALACTLTVIAVSIILLR